MERSSYHDGANSFVICATPDESDPYVFRAGEIVVTGRTLKEAIVNAGRYPGVLFRDAEGRTIRHARGEGGYVTDARGRKRHW